MYENGKMRHVETSKRGRGRKKNDGGGEFH
jgi:hypothetical protein